MKFFNTTYNQLFNMMDREMGIANALNKAIERNNLYVDIALKLLNEKNNCPVDDEDAYKSISVRYEKNLSIVIILTDTIRDLAKALGYELKSTNEADEYWANKFELISFS